MTLITQPSLYEQFQALTVIAKMRFVEDFNGNDVDTGIWTKTNVAGTGTFANPDVIDEGYSIQSGATSGNESALTFNNKRQFDNTTVTIQSVIKAVSNTSNACYFGGSNDILTYSGTGKKGLFVADSANANFSIRSSDGTSSDSTGSVSLNTNWNFVRLVFGSSNIISYINGVIDVTKTTNLPGAKLQPMCGVKTSTSSAKEVRMKFLEAYN